MSLNLRLRRIYHKLPQALVNKLRSINSLLPASALYGKEYKKWKKLLYESETWDEEKKRLYEIEKLRATLKVAYYKTAYYKKLFDECGFDVENFTDLSQMNCIPFLTKQIIQENINDLINNDIPEKDRVYVTTGGSTGIPMGRYKSKADSFKEAAFIDYIWESVGYANNDKVAVLRGAYLGEHGPAYKEGNRLFLSSYHMTKCDMTKQYNALVKFKPKYLHVYPSAISILADFIIKEGLAPISSVEAVLTASENLYPSQREVIEKAFNCKVLDFYGHTEHVCLAGNCKMSNKYHIYWQYGYQELIKPGESKEESLSEGDIVEIIGTSYDNFVMPLIRYKTMDLASYSCEKCACRKNYKILDRIEGRLQELLITPSGRKISMTSINMHNDVFDNVKQFQFYQDNVDYCIINIVKGEKYTEQDEKKIHDAIGMKLGDLTLQIKYVDEIPKTKSGKFRFLVQKLNINFEEECL